jgi:hypothetical protein
MVWALENTYAKYQNIKIKHLEWGAILSMIFQILMGIFGWKFKEEISDGPDAK